MSKKDKEYVEAQLKPGVGGCAATVIVTVSVPGPTPDWGDTVIVAWSIGESPCAVHVTVLAATTWNVAVICPPAQPPAAPAVMDAGVTALVVVVHAG